MQTHPEDTEGDDLTCLVVDSFQGHDSFLGSSEPVLDCLAHTTGMVVGPRWVGGFEHGVSVLVECGAAYSTNSWDIGFDDGAD